MTEIDRAARVAMLVPDSTKSNYAQVVREHAGRAGVSVEDAKATHVAMWRAQHEQNPLAGWNVLADWLVSDDSDLIRYLDGVVDPLTVAQVRALETAKRDPQQAGTAALLNPNGDDWVSREVNASLAHQAAQGRGQAAASAASQAVFDGGSATDAALAADVAASGGELDIEPAVDDPNTPDVDESKSPRRTRKS